jgi:phosphoglycolate phosphatase-like HAD superfamily hydrolase
LTQKGGAERVPSSSCHGCPIVVITSVGSGCGDCRGGRSRCGGAERAGVADLIPRRTSKDDAARSKPDPDIVNAALRQSGAQADKTVMIGDTPYDIEAARRAGIAAIALRCGGHWSDRELHGAIAIFDDPAALLGNWR